MKKTINSREVARVTKQSNAHVNRDIRTYIKYISESPKLDSRNYFIPSHYVDPIQHHKRSCFECTELGCELYANKLTGNKGTIFSAWYVKKFHQMAFALANPEVRLMKAPRSKLFLVMANQAKKNEKLAHHNHVLIRNKRAFEASDYDVSVSYFAKLLNQNGFDTGRNRLFHWFRKNHYLMSNSIDKNVPYQQYRNQDLFDLSEYAVDSGDRKVLEKVTRITPKGQQYFMNLFLGDK